MKEKKEITFHYKALEIGDETGLNISICFVYWCLESTCTQMARKD